jgi:hypothetical protein
MFDFLLNAHQERLLNNLTRGVLSSSCGFLTSLDPKGSHLEKQLDDLAVKTTCTAIMLASAKLINIENKNQQKVHSLLCDRLSRRLNQNMNLQVNIEVACKFMVSCMNKGYKNKIQPYSDDENLIQYFPRVAFMFFLDILQKDILKIPELDIGEQVALSKEFIIAEMKILVLYSETLKAWNDKKEKLDPDDDAELNLNEAINKLGKIVKGMPTKVIDWCRKNPQDGFVLEGKVGLFNVPSIYRKWDGPYGIAITSNRQQLTYNVYFRDLISDIEKISNYSTKTAITEGVLIDKILNTPANFQSDRSLANDVLNANMALNIEEALEYVKTVRKGDEVGLFDDIKNTTHNETENYIENNNTSQHSSSNDTLEDESPWNYEKNCFFEVDVANHPITAMEHSYLSKIRHLYHIRITKLDGVYNLIHKELCYDENTFYKIWFSALLTLGLLQEEYRWDLEFQVYEPFACAMKRFDAELYKIFDALFHYVRVALNEDDTQLDLFEDFQNSTRQNNAISKTVEYLENWLFLDEKNQNTETIIEYFKDTAISAAEKYQKEFQGV